MKKLLFGITSLKLGGAERVLVDLVNKLSNQYDITILTLYPNGEFENQINKNIRIKSILKKEYNAYNKIQHLIISIKILFIPTRAILRNKYTKNYDKVISFLEGPMTTIIANKEATVWIHSDIEKLIENSKLKKILYKKLYEKCQKIVFVSKDNLEKFEKTYKIKTPKIVIHNYLDKELVVEKSRKTIDDLKKGKELTFVTVARLVEAKAIDRLIKVHKRLIDNKYLHQFYVIGDGPLKEKLKNQIKDSKVENTFFLMGPRDNPYPYIKSADVFALLTLYEGLPMVLLEAKCLDKNIVITNTASREAIENYSKKVIAENNEEDIYQKLKGIIEGTLTFNEHVNDIDENSIILKQIEDLLKE